MSFINLTNVSTMDDPGIVNLTNLITGTYMGLEVTICPAQGSFDVNVQNNFGDYSEKEISEMVMMLMSDKIMQGI